MILRNLKPREMSAKSTLEMVEGMVKDLEGIDTDYMTTFELKFLREFADLEGISLPERGCEGALMDSPEPTWLYHAR